MNFDIKYQKEKKVVSSKLANVQQVPIVDHLVHYRNMFASPEFFIRRKVDYSKMRVFNEKYRKESERLKTFGKFPQNKKILISSLAKSGFYSVDNNFFPDQVKCIFCQGTLENWGKNDMPMRKHKHCYPTCPFVISLNVANEPSLVQFPKYPNLDPDIGQSGSDVIVSVDCCILPVRSSTYAINERINHMDLDWRESTFLNHRNIVRLAKEGLFVTKKGNELFLCCAWCEKSTEILDGVENLKGALFHKSDCKISVIPAVADEDKAEACSTFCAVEYAVTLQEIEARTETNLVYQSIAEGFAKASKEDIKSVIERRLKETGDDFSSLYEFLKAVKTERRRIRIKAKSSKENSTKQTCLVLGDYQCVVCLDKPVEVIFLPCGHLKTCEACSQAMVTCPVCRVVIVRRVRNMRFNEATSG